ncbi:MAG: plasmid mobilization relaxosome protein MobC [Ruminiclostridium sp.]|uniref:plasmid mobilization protein n=1 Tax=Ruminococcus sp. TaxID=41978 RepID=UPI0025CF0BEC|nr:plasmid mobilization relaxosome protein MobC [Ruminococcus sp.]MBR1433285.1 plasmid mobilization relaxosome protein MobC [Ruminococcus sp.]MBR1832337.1 plasmid mobilization relaxosome protein MobC [Ruminiclostridium sp.]
MRKYKQVKRKEIVFELDEWELIEQWASKFKISTTEYIKQATLTDKITIDKSGESNAVMIGALKKIGGNINQLAKKANEINSIYAADYEKMRKEYETLCRMLNVKLSTQV